MEFVDRVSAYPNRYIITNENGDTHYAVIERADEPVTPGTPLNAETFNSLFLFEQSTEFPGCYFRTVDGETEWLNPPLVEGIEYRTTERCENKPVYRKSFSVTFSENAGGADSVVTKDITHTTPGFADLVRVHAKYTNESGKFVYSLPYITTAGGFFCVGYVGRDRVQIRSVNAVIPASRKFSFDLAYTKE
jgi:hypothetical protein